MRSPLLALAISQTGHAAVGEGEGSCECCVLSIFFGRSAAVSVGCGVGYATFDYAAFDYATCDYTRGSV